MLELQLDTGVFLLSKGKSSAFGGERVFVAISSLAVR
jgi:hypothetical protein